jgi:hypothetical protein
MNAIIDQQREGQMELPFELQETETEFQIQQRVYGKFGLNYQGPPRRLDKEEKAFFIKCLREEIDEYEKADTIEDEYDAALDTIVFSFDILIRMGLPFREGFIEVAKSNISKQLAGTKSKSKRLWELDLVKPANWRAPNLKAIVKGLRK